MTSTKPTASEIAPGPDRIGAQFRPDAAFLHHGQRRRQRARPQQHREVVGRCGGETAADLTAPAGDRLADHRRADHLAVQHDGEAVVDVGPRDVGEAPRADGVEGEVDHPLAGLRIGAGARIGQVAAIDVDPPAHRDLLVRVVLHRQEVHARRRRRSGVRVGRLVDQLERHVRGLAEQLLDPVGIADAGQLHDDAAVALLGDLRIDHAGLVDAAADDLDRLLHRAAGPRVQRDRRQRQRDRAVRRRGQVEFRRAGRALGGDQRADRRHRRVESWLASRSFSSMRFCSGCASSVW